MGDALDETMLRAFTDELHRMEKEAGAAEILRGIGGFARQRLSRFPMMAASRIGAAGRTTGEFLGNPLELLGRMRHPVQGMRAGWAKMSPGLRAQEKFVEKGTTAGEALAKARATPVEQLRTQAQQRLVEGGLDPARALKKVTELSEKDLRRAAEAEVTGSGMFGRFGEHMAAPSVGLGQAWRSGQGAGRLRAVAEELSRRGWTGGQSWSKYIPWGEKAWLPATAGLAIPDMVNAPAASPTGEGGAFEKGLGALGMGAGMVLGGGMGIVPALGAFYLGEKAGGRIGRILDRIRGGGTAEQALFAPSPTEATEQLQNIYKHYG